MRKLITLLLLIGYSSFITLYRRAYDPIIQAQLAPQQLADSNTTVALVQTWYQQPWVLVIVTILLLIALFRLWQKPIQQAKKSPLLHHYLLLLPLLGLLVACKPYGVTQIIEIKPNETAFVVPLLGDTTSQAQFQSVSYLEQRQVAAKQVEIPVREHKIGRGFWNIEWVPTVAVIIVDRTPVTREWTSANDTGTSISNQAFGVESRESIDFKVGATASALVEEKNAAKFLYYFSGKSLPEVMDENIRGFVQAELFNEFGARTLEQGRAEKREIFESIFQRTQGQFEPLGITITSLGGSEGLIYSDSSVQAVINDNFEAQQRQIQAEAFATAQAIENSTLVDQANAAATATVVAGQAAAAVLRERGQQLSQFPGLTDYEYAQRSQGRVPETLVVSGEGQNLPFAFFLNAHAGVSTPVAVVEAAPTATPTPAPAP